MPYYDDEVAGKVVTIAHKLEAQLKSQNFEGSNLISILSFLQVFQIACNMNGIHESAAMSLRHLFMKKPATAGLSACECLSSSGLLHQKDKLTSCPQVVCYLLKTYATVDINKEYDVEISDFKEPNGQSRTEYAQTLWTKALRCGPV